MRVFPPLNSVPLDTSNGVRGATFDIAKLQITVIYCINLLIIRLFHFISFFFFLLFFCRAKEGFLRFWECRSVQISSSVKKREEWREKKKKKKSLFFWVSTGEVRNKEIKKCVIGKKKKKKKKTDISKFLVCCFPSNSLFTSLFHPTLLFHSCRIIFFSPHIFFVSPPHRCFLLFFSSTNTHIPSGSPIFNSLISFVTF